MKKNRIWIDGEGLTFSTITELLGDDDGTPKRLKDCTLDLTDALALKIAEMEKMQERARELDSEINFITGNIGVCIDFGVRKLKCKSALRYIHDDKAEIVVVEMKNGFVSIIKEPLTGC